MKYLFGAHPHLGKISFDLAELFSGQRVFGGHTAVSLTHSGVPRQETLFGLMLLPQSDGVALRKRCYAVKNSKFIERAAGQNGFCAKPIEQQGYYLKSDMAFSVL
jgi:hypothetical protein